MASILFKWLLAAFFSNFISFTPVHPYFISVTEIEQVSAEKTLEVSCKIFTDDFEKTLRESYHTSVDLLHPKDKTVMNNLVKDYVLKHLKINIDGKNVSLKFLGYEEIEEGIYSYYQADNITSVKNITITDNILYDFTSEQVNLIHVTVSGTRKSLKLNNPEETARFSF